MSDNDEEPRLILDFEEYKALYIQNFGPAHDWMIQFSFMMYNAANDEEMVQKLTNDMIVNAQAFYSGRFN